ncbi:MAG: hypothetical protein J7K15_10390 [Deltaproteobacteria bacterium]|nr:hypothetical protein [Deltaproteobacteria bacterium]
MTFLTRRYLEELTKQKEKYFSKVVSDDAVYVNWLRTYDTADVFYERMLQALTLADYYNISFILLFAENPSVVEPLNIEFSVSLPSIEEILQGIYAVFESVDLSIEFPGQIDYPSFVDYNIRPEYRDQAKELEKVKARYGITRYGEGVYDPVIVAEFVRNVITRYWIQFLDRELFRRWLQEYGAKLGIASEVQELVWDRLGFVDVATQGPFILGFSRLGEGWLVPEGHEFERVLVERLDGEIVEVPVREPDDYHHGFVLGVSRLGYDILSPRGSAFLTPLPQVLDVIRTKEFRLRSRYVHTATAFANYVTARELTSPHRCARIHQYHTLRIYMLFAEEVAERVCRKYRLDKYTCNRYRTAARNLLALGLRRHRWGEEPLRNIDLDELRVLWIARWVKEGLKEDILNEIFEGCRPWLQHLRSLKYQVGELVKQTRISLASYRKR